MKLKFDANQAYQLQAINSIVDIFEGLPEDQNDISFELKSEKELTSELGIGNLLTLVEKEMLQNVRKIQKRNNLPESSQLTSGDYPFPNFTVEMETGTGKTYVYLRTIFELNKKYDYKKFIIVVPSVAIREGTLKNLDITKKHFKDLYGIEPHYFVYNSKKPGMIRSFATSNMLEIMIINIDAFKRDVRSVEDERNATLFHREADRLSGRAPKEFIASVRPIVILDEPQSIDNSDAGKKAIKSLNPLFVLRYSATHRQVYNLIYRLDPVQAYDMGLVKQIVVTSVLDEPTFNGAYVKLIDVTNKNGVIQAKIEYHEDTGTARYTVKTKQVKVNSDLFVLSGEREEYRNGYIITEINLTEDGDGSIKFNDGRVLRKGEAIGGITDEIKRFQIRETIEEHLKKENKLKELGIKVLSLFFIDRVAHYRYYDDQGNAQKGKYAIWFEEEYKQLISKNEYKWIDTLDISTIHDGYFSQDKKGRVKDTSGITEDDISTYDRIMKEKEKLLSFEDPLRFIFSHSALREGWDNPNVFQVCTLNETNTEIKKRQEIGRGLRLPVNQKGERVFDKTINKLVVVANEHYEDFAKKLQQEYIEEGVEFGIVKIEKLKKIFSNESEGAAEQKAKELHEILIAKGYLDAENKVTDIFTKSIANNTFNLGGKFENEKYRIINLVEKHELSTLIKEKKHRRTVRPNTRVLQDSEFKSLWKKINKKTMYSVNFDSSVFITNASHAIHLMRSIQLPKIQVIKVDVDIDTQGVVGSEFHNRTESVKLRYEIPDVISYIQRETELTRKTICEILLRSRRIEDVKINPQQFLDQVVTIIKQELTKLIVDGIKYEKLAGQEFEMSLFKDEEIVEEMKKITQSNKSPYQLMVLDSSIEKEYADRLNQDASVKFFVKLPNWFKVETPIGMYNPDWAILKDENGLKLYLVRETKGTIEEDERRGTENKKIKFAKKHFEALGIDFKDIDPPFTSIN